MDMNINLNIKATEICVAIDNLASAILNMGSQSVGAVEQAQPATRKSRTSKTAETAQITETASTVEATTEVVQTVTEKDEQVKNQEETAKTYTLVEVRAKLAALSAAGHAPQIKELFGKFGAKKLTEVPEENYVELMAFAEEIG
ncbi:hypothetical protein [Pelosinus sp. IPA-1]|uniref:hypothetical protein n=1 Tax=Pelosinus sp. IPA-1 TaxID=3029569 RepID=UPI00243623B8|nr:hypothetical protein [Pelosinus sp. IPA-1]GMB00893.1 hypothetical protein PIPA1_36920 [Pelosinus sp. IPA-1]